MFVFAIVVYGSYNVELCKNSSCSVWKIKLSLCMPQRYMGEWRY